MVAFRRYTNLADLIHILREKKISLRDPRSWDDKNDSYFLERYKKYKGLKTLLALCFADDKEETYHHWSVFSGGKDGVSIRFDRESLLNAFTERCKCDQVTPLHRCVDYRNIDDLRSNPPCVEDLPFLKWSPYGDENEYRILYANESVCERSWGFRITVDCIDHISLSPWLPAVLEQSVCEQLKSIRGCSSLQISRSRVIDFNAWRTIADRAGSFDPIQLAGTWPGKESLESLFEKLD